MRIRVIAAALAGVAAATVLVSAGPAQATARETRTCASKTAVATVCFYPRTDKFCITNLSRTRGNYVEIEWFTRYNGRGGRVVNKRGYFKTVCKGYDRAMKERETVSFRGWLFSPSGIPLSMTDSRKTTI
jgi:hypothetical protein